jgi:hypothetical protein
MVNGVDIEKQFKDAIRQERERAKRKILYALVMLGCVYVAGILAYHYTEGWAWEDSIYFTTSTITTVGFGDMVPRTYYGRLATNPLMWIGIAVGFYFIYTLQEYGRAKAETRIEGVLKHVDNLTSTGRKHMGRLAGGKKE